MAVRTCDRCGTKMPFGVRRKPIGGELLCGGCSHGREGRPLTNHGARQAAGPPTPPPFLRDPKPKGGSGELPPEIAPNPAAPDAAGAAGPTPPEITDAPGAAPGAPPAPGAPAPGGTPGGGLGTFAPDRQSDKVVRVCPFCGSGQILGQSDGSIECGHEDISFLVEVLPKHPFQPLVGPDGQPFEMSAEDGVAIPEVGVARAADGPGGPPQPGDSPVDGASAPGAEDNGDEDDDEEDDLPPFLKGGSLYITDEGTALNEDAYVEHLAHSLFG